MDAVLTKLMIVQWVGPLPEWTEQWLANTQRITDAGYGWNFLLDADIQSIRSRITNLGIDYPPLEGRKLCDYRPALGEMYAVEVAGFDFWGHTDLDCVYGPIWDYVTDELLADCDLFSNDPAPDMCGPFSLYRTATASHIFRHAEDWREIFQDATFRGFDETGIVPALLRSGLRMTHRHWEGPDSMYVHFTASKQYPDLWRWPWGEAADYVPATASVAS